MSDLITFTQGNFPSQTNHLNSETYMGSVIRITLELPFGVTRNFFFHQWVSPHKRVVITFITFLHGLPLHHSHRVGRELPSGYVGRALKPVDNQVELALAEVTIERMFDQVVNQESSFAVTSLIGTPSGPHTI